MWSSGKSRRFSQLTVSGAADLHLPGFYSQRSIIPLFEYPSVLYSLEEVLQFLTTIEWPHGFE